MRKIAAAAALTLALSGCGVRGVVVTVEEPAPSPSPTTVFTAEKNSEFVRLTLASYPSLTSDPGTLVRMIGWAQEACKAMDQGMAPEKVAMFMMNQGMEQPTAVFITASAVAAMCPQHDWLNN